MKQTRRRFFLNIVCLALFAALAAAPICSAQATHVSALPNGVEIADGSSLLDVEIYANHLVRVHVRPDGKQSPRTLVLDPNLALAASPALHRTEASGIYTLSEPGISVRIREAKPFSIDLLDASGHTLLSSADPIAEARSSSVSLHAAAQETLYGIHGLDMDETSGSIVRNSGGKVAAGSQGNSGAPFIFSTHYSVLVDSDGGEFASTYDGFAFRHSSRSDVEYFIFTGPPLESMATLSHLAGAPPLPPKWSLGFLNTQWGATQNEVEKIVSTYRAKQLPLDCFILDFDWKAWGEDIYGEWRWNSTSGPGAVAPNKFPGGADGSFAAHLKAQGVHLGGILKPRILTTVAGNPNQSTEAAAYATAHNFWYPAEPITDDYFSHRPARDIDFSIPAARTWFWQHLEPAYRAGMTSWWNDEADISGPFVFSNFQFLNMGRMIYDGQRATSNERVWTINRNFYLGSSRYGYAGWSGDIQTGFASMAFQRRRMIAALNTGEFHWSMDTGGFHGHPSDENYARWIEFAAFVPIMRVHGELNEKRQPWMHGPIAEAAARHALTLRYQFLPYIYSYERQNTEGHVGLVRPLLWQFPSDPASARAETEWMFGDALLVSPIVAQGEIAHTVHLPPGNWFEWTTGKRYDGNQNIVLAADAKTWSDIPLFVRSGSIVATQPGQLYVNQKLTSEISLDIFPVSSPAAFTVYDDDGQTYAYEKGSYLRQQITAANAGTQTIIVLDPATGSYTSPLRTYLLRIHADAKRVLINGKPIAQAASAGLAAETAANWQRSSDRFGAVTLLRVPAASKTPLHIALE